MENSETHLVNNGGVIAFVLVKCADMKSRTFHHSRKFALPRKLIDAVLEIRMNVHINRAFDIPDSICEKSLKIIVRNKNRLNPGFYHLLKMLEDASRKGYFKLTVEGV